MSTFEKFLIERAKRGDNDIHDCIVDGDAKTLTYIVRNKLKKELNERGIVIEKLSMRQLITDYEASLGKPSNPILVKIA